ncbi:MAG: hypothetical protein Q7V53_03070 [Caldisericota bacterium]|nr:hypothetical protein [Caldisericota bacterium]
MTDHIAIDQMKAIIRTSRAAMLMERMAADFNDLPMLPPLKRVMVVGQALIKARDLNPSVENILGEVDAFNALREEGRRRGAGEVQVSAAFVPDFNRSVAREGGHA